jgi:hypothetical protein
MLRMTLVSHPSLAAGKLGDLHSPDLSHAFPGLKQIFVHRSGTTTLNR